MATAASSYCEACGPAQVSHTTLWLSNSSDVLAEHMTGLRNAPLLRAFAALGEHVLDALQEVFYAISRAAGVITLGDDVEKARSRRSRLLWEEARRRNIPMRQLFLFNAPSDLFEIEINSGRRIFQSIPLPHARSEEAGGIDDKIAFKRLMRENGLPVPESRSVQSVERAKEALADFGVVCVKPQSGSNGRHTFPYVTTEADVVGALASVKEICAVASIEEYLEGNVCRATCVDGALIGFLESYYPTITGDGTATVAELVARANAAKPAGVDDITLSSFHADYIRRRGYAPSDILPAGVSLPIIFRAGTGHGGSNREYGRAIHPSFIPIIERAAKLTKLSVVGFDLIIPNPLESADSQKWGFIEANSLPWIDLHAAPYAGEPIDLSPAVWDLWQTRATGN